MKFSLKNPIQAFSLLLAVFAVGALSQNLRVDVLMTFGAILLMGGIVFVLLDKILKRKKMVWNVLITLLITGLLVHPVSISELWQPALAAVLVMGVKFWPNFRRQPIFNPAALGLLVASFAGVFVSWWGASFGLLALVLVVLTGLYATWRFRKWYLVLTFLILNAIWVCLGDSLESVKFIYTDATIYFLVMVMLLEPKTSPIKKYPQIMAGVIAVIFYRVGINVGIPNVELWMILLINVLHFLDQKFKLIK